MATRTLLCEAGTLRAREGGKWAVTLITPGKGSSGTYSAEMLAEYGPKAFKKGMKLWWGHPKEGEGPGDRDPRDQWGVLEEDAEPDENGALGGAVRLLPHWKDVVESLGDQASLSIYAQGDHDEDGNVTALLEHFTNSVDIVSYPGREGSGLKQKLEAARAASAQPDAASAQESINKEEARMEELKKAVEALTALLSSYISEQKAADEAARQAEADAQAGEKDVAEAVESAVAAVEAVKAAKVLPSLEEKLIENAKKGVDVTDDLAFAVKVTAEAAAPAKDEDTSSYVHESLSAGAGDDLSLNLGGVL